MILALAPDKRIVSDSRRASEVEGFQQLREVDIESLRDLPKARW
jgi:hypothetical protein